MTQGVSITSEQASELYGSTDNLGKNLNDVVEFDNDKGYMTIAFHCHAPTGGEVTFEGSFDGATWQAINMRNIDTDEYTQKTDNGNNFIGSIAGARRFRLRTSSAGSANGTVIGSAYHPACIIEGIEFGWPPHRFGFTPVHKDGSYTTQQTNTSIWTPTSGKKFVLTDLLIVVSGVNNGTVTIFDETNSSGNIVWSGLIDTTKDSIIPFSHAFRTPFVSSAVDNSIKITTSAAVTVDVQLHGYEV